MNSSNPIGIELRPRQSVYYRTLQFDSLLVAHWAAFFDALGWLWSYHPESFPTWEPKFVLKGSRLVYVEVVPDLEFPASVAKAIEQSGMMYECLIVGHAPFAPQPGQLALGWLGETSWDKFLQLDWSPAYFCRKQGTTSQTKNPRSLYGFEPATGLPIDRITGCQDGETRGLTNRLSTAYLQSLWQQAGRQLRMADD